MDRPLTGSEVPAYDDLPVGPNGGRLGWHQFPDEDLGLVSLLTPETSLAAVASVRRGAVFSLNAPVDLFTPPLTLTRGAVRHHVHTVHLPAITGLDDMYDNFFPQASSQWDSLAHASYSSSLFYNGVTEAEILAGDRLGVDHWARKGIVTRAVVLDVTELRTPYDPASRTAFSVEDLEVARRRAGVELRSGDVILLYTGFAAWYRDLDTDRRAGLPGKVASAGLEQSESMCRYLWDAQVAGVASDNFAVEVWPGDFGPEAAPFGFIHQMLIGSFGMALGELWWLEDLVLDCREDGVYDAMLVSAPIHMQGGIGSPANAVAIK